LFLQVSGDEKHPREVHAKYFFSFLKVFLLKPVASLMAVNYPIGFKLTQVVSLIGYNGQITACNFHSNQRSMGQARSSSVPHWFKPKETLPLIG
jgi:hypothetical protein